MRRVRFSPRPPIQMGGMGVCTADVDADAQGVRGARRGERGRALVRQFDTGDVVEVERFPIDPDAHTALSLDLESGQRLVGLFGRVMDRAGIAEVGALLRGD